MSAPAAERAAAVRRSVGWFRLGARALLEVAGGDRVRWLNGMLSNDVARLEPGHARSGCYALLLTPKGHIAADLHVLQRGDVFWLELAAEALAPVTAQLEKYIIADDVQLADRSRAFARFAVEGPRAPEAVAPFLGGAPPPGPDSWCAATLGGAEIALAAFGWSGESGFQLFVPAPSADAAASALAASVRACGGSEADAEALEVLRIEAGIPRLGAELDEDVLPAEAHLTERAVSFSKGCYTGQEIVARLDARGQVQHLLVGLHFEGGEPPSPGAGIEVGGRCVGEVTSACRSAAAGVIGLGYVRRALAAVGTGVSVCGRAARVAALPFAGIGARGAA
ncbi:MAG TPA: glycine cleavage T C-terminal barrel domain-containing protein [Myxococcota bacterium]